MSIFGRSQTVTSQEVTAPVYEGYHAEVNGDILAIQESWEDQLAVIEALHALDMEELAMRSDVKALQESGAEASEIEARQEAYEVVTESMGKDALEKIKAFFSKLWGKIKAFFKSVVRVFDGVVKNAQDFVKKYEGQIKGLNLRGFKYKMFNYTNIDEVKFMDADPKTEAEELYDLATKSSLQAENDALADKLHEKTTKMKENKEDDLSEYRGKLIGSGTLTAEQFGKELYSAFRGGAREKGDASEQEVHIQTIMDKIKSAGDAKKKADEFAKKVDEQFSKIIKDITALSTKLGSASAGKDGFVEHDLGDDKGGKRRMKSGAVSTVTEALRTYGTIFSAKKDIQLTIFRSWKTAWDERNSTYKSVCLAAFRHKAEK
jgi:hypothetical protein